MLNSPFLAAWMQEMAAITAKAAEREKLYRWLLRLREEVAKTGCHGCGADANPHGCPIVEGIERALRGEEP